MPNAFIKYVEFLLVSNIFLCANKKCAYDAVPIN